MSDDPARAHGRALVLARRCPHCAERAGPATLFRGKPCGHCGRSVADAGLYGGDLVTELEASSRRGFIGVAVAVGLVHLFLGWVPLLDAAVLVAATVWIRFFVLHPATEAMSPARRIVTRLTARLWSGTLVAAVLVFSQLLTLIGAFGLPVKAVIGAGVVVAAVFIVRRYVLWQLGREAKGKDVEGWEYGVLILSMVAVVAAIAGVVLVVFTVASVLSDLLGGAG